MKKMTSILASIMLYYSQCFGGTSFDPATGILSVDHIKIINTDTAYRATFVLTDGTFTVLKSEEIKPEPENIFDVILSCIDDENCTFMWLEEE